MRMGILDFRSGRTVLKLKEPLMLESGSQDGHFCLSHEDPCLFATDKSWSDTSDTIREELAMLWEDYALAPDGVLTNDGIALKRKLLSMVEVEE